MVENIAIIGGSGAIGSALTRLLSCKYPNARIHVFSRQLPEKTKPGVIDHVMDYQNEHAIAQSAASALQGVSLDYVMVATGILHDGVLVPEKSLYQCSAKNFQHLFAANAIFPALVAKYFLPKLNQDKRSVFSALSARVGSISDNRLGGWYAYRASKAALNMIIKNAAIEVGRRNKHAIVAGLHPGTVDSDLSKPFQANVPAGKLFTPDFSAKKLWQVLEGLKSEHSGRCFAWDGQEIAP